MQFETIETPRLILRKLTAEAHTYVHTHYSDEELKAFFALQTPEALEREKRMFRLGLTMFNKSFLTFHLLDKETRQTIGWCGFHTWFPDHFRAEIGYGMYTESMKRKGLMTEALKSVLDFGFDDMKLHRVEALIADYNMPSLKLVERFGFTKEGTMREHYFVDGVAEDSVLFALLAAEYKGKRNLL